MTRNSDRQRFRNEDLVLKVAPHADRTVWDETRYELYLETLCSGRSYQKEAILTALRFLLGRRYDNLRALAEENFEASDVLRDRYGTFASMERHLQLPLKLSASLDLATATGKSYVLYGIAAVMLAEGAVDRVLVLCPSTTIESGLLEKFKQLASDADLRDLLPGNAAITTPRIINATESITEGTICVENYHAVLEHVGSSVRDTLRGKGAHTLILNDEAHHVANERSVQTAKRWKEFLLDEEFAFHHIIGVSGTCYVGDEYFSDVIFRFSLRQAMEEKYVKLVDYVAEMPQTNDPDEKWQVVHRRHDETKKKLKTKKLLPLTLVVAQTIAKAKDVADELRHFLVELGGVPANEIDKRVLEIYTGSADLSRLPSVDLPESDVEWIVSVSMLTEGWDVKRVFQIVPHEERAFNSKLLISQVLGRGLRVPASWGPGQPQVTVFNHDAWAPRIRHLVSEVLELEKRITSQVVESSPFHFKLHNINYDLETATTKKPMTGEYDLFAKGYVDLPTTLPEEDVEVQFERAGTGTRYSWQTKITHKTYSAREVALEMYARLGDAEDPDDPHSWPPGTYTKKFPVDRLEQLVHDSLQRVSMSVATETSKQKLLQSLGPLRRRVSETIRYTPVAKERTLVSTSDRRSDSVSASELRHDKSLFYTLDTRDTLDEEQLETFDELVEPGSGFKVIPVQNPLDLKTPLNCVIADHDPEKKFISLLTRGVNLSAFDAWIKSTTTRFYEIDFAWKKGEHPKRGKFSPDFFLKSGEVIVVVEIKADDELKEPSEENRKKAEYAQEHFRRLNELLEADGEAARYKFTFLTPKSFNSFFTSVKKGEMLAFRSDLDVKLAEVPQPQDAL